MDSLPDELQLKIFRNLIPDKYCDIKPLIASMIVCKDWYRIINDKGLIEYYLCFIYDNIYNIRQLNIILKYETIYKLQCYKNIFLKYNYALLNFLTYEFVRSLPVCYFTNSRCLDGLCSTDCYNNNHNIDKYANSNIMRGIDDKNRDYILVLYKNLSTNEIMYEFIYHKHIDDFEIITFSGIYNKSYIGLNVFKHRHIEGYDVYRELNLESYKYLSRLINNIPCGVIKYNPETDLYYESYDELIRIL